MRIPELKIEEPYDYPTRWLIPSKSEGGASYLVDLGSRECQCRWHVTSVAPALKRGEMPARFCSHYHEARRLFTDWAIKEFVKREK